ncbi:hypothetical protein KsCSTR_41790 [Candidatus Kuenenia stuttgartiensis]|uniref:Uncharacterized protein n=1 Tax=Kuenenia stuttgartiensis TaxID=174633 RepID=Q1PXJ7_KUEST|nr:hypothetical protein KsCSTR_41790 [Candidatus Kuenenia stuttgartiensis]TVL99053.1 MAG: hypothetical protein CV080_08480 [Candidatus Kuenenia stuttgartiensis]CAJ71955.1 unknown protein [Candidatus Kuenenia stuttgartiensis]
MIFKQHKAPYTQEAPGKAFGRNQISKYESNSKCFEHSNSRRVKVTNLNRHRIFKKLKYYLL